MQSLRYFSENTGGSPAFNQVFHYVLEGINSQKLRPGDVLYETSLASELHMSRTPVRQALTKLVGEGFLETLPGKRGYHVPKLTQEDMREVFQMRKILEGKAAEFAAQEARMEDVAYLRDLNELEKKYSLSREVHAYHEVNAEFHFTLVRLSANRYIEQIYHPVFWRSMLYVYFLGEFHPLELDRLENDPNSPAEHRRITEAIADRDSNKARELAEEHLRSTRAYRMSLESTKASLLLR